MPIASKICLWENLKKYKIVKKQIHINLINTLFSFQYQDFQVSLRKKNIQADTFVFFKAVFSLSSFLLPFSNRQSNPQHFSPCKGKNKNKTKEKTYLKLNLIKALEIFKFIMLSHYTEASEGAGRVEIKYKLCRD